MNTVQKLNQLKCSSRSAVLTFGPISKTSLRRMLKNIGVFPYRIQTGQSLNRRNIINRVQYYLFWCIQYIKYGSGVIWCKIWCDYYINKENIKL